MQGAPASVPVAWRQIASLSRWALRLVFQNNSACLPGEIARWLAQSAQAPTSPIGDSPPTAAPSLAWMRRSSRWKLSSASRLPGSAAAGHPVASAAPPIGTAPAFVMRAVMS